MSAVTPTRLAQPVEGASPGSPVESNVPQVAPSSAPSKPTPADSTPPAADKLASRAALSIAASVQEAAKTVEQLETQIKFGEKLSAEQVKLLLTSGALSLDDIKKLLDTVSDRSALLERVLKLANAAQGETNKTDSPTHIAIRRDAENLRLLLLELLGSSQPTESPAQSEPEGRLQATQGDQGAKNRTIGQLLLNLITAISDDSIPEQALNALLLTNSGAGSSQQIATRSGSFANEIAKLVEQALGEGKIKIDLDLLKIANSILAAPNPVPPLPVEQSKAMDSLVRAILARLSLPGTAHQSDDRAASNAVLSDLLLNQPQPLSTAGAKALLLTLAQTGSHALSVNYSESIEQANRKHPASLDLSSPLALLATVYKPLSQLLELQVRTLREQPELAGTPMIDLLSELQKLTSVDSDTANQSHSNQLRDTLTRAINQSSSIIINTNSIPSQNFSVELIRTSNLLTIIGLVLDLRFPNSANARGTDPAILLTQILIAAKALSNNITSLGRSESPATDQNTGRLLKALLSLEQDLRSPDRTIDKVKSRASLVSSDLESWINRSESGPSSAATSTNKQSKMMEAVAQYNSISLKNTPLMEALGKQPTFIIPALFAGSLSLLECSLPRVEREQDQADQANSRKVPGRERFAFAVTLPTLGRIEVGGLLSTDEAAIQFTSELPSTSLALSSKLESLKVVLEGEAGFSRVSLSNQQSHPVKAGQNSPSAINLLQLLK